MSTRNIVVVGASAGGLQALETLVGGLPEDFPGTVFIVLHLSPESPGYLAKILDRSSQLPVSTAEDTSSFERGHVYVAPANYHLLVENGHVNVVGGPRENRMRPAIDPLFRSAALAYGPRVIGIVLTGCLNDGTSGLIAVKKQGGIAIVQDPSEAPYPEMPENALMHVQVDHVLPAGSIAETLGRLIDEPVGEMSASADSLRREVEITKGHMMNDESDWGQSVSVVCPECGGPMWEQSEGSLRRLRCKIGHGYTQETFLGAKTDEVEEALAAAERTLNEKSVMLERMAREMREKERSRAAEAFEKRAQEMRGQADTVRKVLYGNE